MTPYKTSNLHTALGNVWRSNFPGRLLYYGHTWEIVPAGGVDISQELLPAVPGIAGETIFTENPLN